MYRVLLVTCALGVAAGMNMDMNNMVMKFLQKKVFEDCFGKEVMDEWKLRIMTACAKCQGDDITVDKLLQVYRKRNQQMQQPMFAPFGFGAPQFFPNNKVGEGMISQQPQSRRRRQALFTSEMVLGAREQAISKINNITCIMKELNLVNEDLTINVAYMKEVFQELPDPGLRDDMIEMVDMCDSFSKCMPLEKVKNPVVRENGRILAFMKCENKQKVMTCMKHNIKKELGEFAMMGPASSTDGESMLEDPSGPLQEMFEFMVIAKDPVLDLP